MVSAFSLKGPGALLPVYGEWPRWEVQQRLEALHWAPPSCTWKNWAVSPLGLCSFHDLTWLPCTLTHPTASSPALLSLMRVRMCTFST